ncbi:TonB-dependent receptor [Massilibacteroides vaginae]|uniref:TonB-dependent receptor n=1 Tax=Massilibacteroides vaginae TaxID=1673718 RepID=UPI000A1C90A4|nr:TonB-dependent receptor [Massilibacteroides vaginae]
MNRGLFTSFCLLFLLLNPVLTFAQTENLSLSVKNITLQQFFEAIEKQSALRFSYRDVVLDNKKDITLNVINEPVESILSKVLPQRSLQYEINGRMISITVVQPKTQKRKFVSGLILDEYSEPVIGANVVEGGTTNGTITDMDGKFTLEVSDDAKLNISYVGYLSMNIPANQIPGTIKLQEDKQTLDEIVVVGYGTQKRKDFTGSVSSLKLENSPIALSPNTNALEALKGTTTGLDIGASNSAGGTPSMQIRGQKSIKGSNDPLIVLDGIVFLGSLRDIDPNTIASYDVLKDATSAAAYGSRAANGVIIITTKKGKIGKPVISFNTSVGTQRWQQKPNLANAETYVRSVNVRQGLAEDADPMGWLNASPAENYQKGESVNWLDEISRNGLMQNYQVAIAGGSEKMTYYLSTSYTDQQGVIIGDDYSRMSLSAKINTDITDWLQIGMNGSYNYSDYSGVGANVYNAMTMNPYGKKYWDAENKKLERWPDYQSTENPLWGTENTRYDLDTYNNFRIVSHALIKCPWLEGLSYRFNYMQTGDFIYRDQFYYENHYIQEGNNPERYSSEALQKLLATANGSKAHTNINSYVFDHILNYKQTFDKHNVDATLVYTRDSYHSKRTISTGTDFSANGNTALGIDGLPKAGVQKMDQDNVEKRNIGYLARLNYSFDDRYHFTASYRRDGSSVFGVNNKWGNFPAVGVAWTTSNENFLKGNNLLNHLKVKTSWGVNGNQGISPYGTLSQVVSGSSGGIRYEFNNMSDILYGIKINTLGNSLLGWEKTSSFNGGIESAFLNNRINLDVDFYFSRTIDQLFERQIPVMTGFKTILASMGQVNNKGIEINLRTSNIVRQDFEWDSHLTFWSNRNVLDKLYGDDMDGDGREDDDISNNLFIGKSLGAIYGYRQDGIVQESDTEYISKNGVKPGDAKFKDLDGDGIISSADREILGYNKENFKLNLGNTVRYKNVELYVLFTGVFGGNGYYMSSNKPAYLVSSDKVGNNILDHPWWTAENKSNVYPSATYNDSKFLGLQKRSFVRLQDVTLSYTFKQDFLRKMKFESMKVFVAGKNLFYITGWDGGDPELGQTLGSTYPVPTTYTLGLNVSF